MDVLNPSLRIFGLFLAMGLSAFAQEQESGLLERVLATRDRQNADPMQNKEFSGAGVFRSEAFETPEFQGVKSARMKEFSTKSFFGIKNPWFGRDVYDTGDLVISRQTDRAASREFDTAAFGVGEFADAERTTRLVEQPVTTEDINKNTSVRPKAQGGVDDFANISRDLSIDDVRALLNKGQNGAE